MHGAIGWAGEQPWSNTWGMSYLAMSQHQAASLHPEYLKAMIAIGTDVDLYEEVAYSGGIFNEQFWSIWKASGLVPAICGDIDVADFIQTLNTEGRATDKIIEKIGQIRRLRRSLRKLTTCMRQDSDDW